MADANPYNSPFEAQFDPERAQLFIIQQLLRGIHTCTLVEVLAVRPASGKVGFVDVQPMILETTTDGVVVEQTPIYNVPYLRYQGGPSAVILDPAVGDTGLALFAERDITNVKATQQPGPAATDRTHSSADALYIGGVLNADPTQWVKFLPNAGGIDVHTPGPLTGTAGGGMTLNVTGTANIVSSGAATLQAPSISLKNSGAALLKLLNSAFATWAAGHVHSNGNGGANTGIPTTLPPASGQTSIVQAE